MNQPETNNIAGRQDAKPCTIGGRLLWWGLVAAWLGVIWEFGESQALPMASGDVLRWLTRKGLHVLVYEDFGIDLLGGLLGASVMGTIVGRTALRRTEEA